MTFPEPPVHSERAILFTANHTSLFELQITTLTNQLTPPVDQEPMLFQHWLKAFQSNMSAVDKSQASANTVPCLAQYPTLLIPQFPVQFLIQLHKCTLSLSIRPILCILHVFLKMRIPHYSRQRIINLGNSGEIQEKSDKKLFIFFRRCEIHFPLGEI